MKLLTNDQLSRKLFDFVCKGSKQGQDKMQRVIYNKCYAHVKYQ